MTGLVDYANTHFELAQAALRNGDFATYGTEMDNVQARARGPRPADRLAGPEPGAMTTAAVASSAAAPSRTRRLPIRTAILAGPSS